MWIVAKSNSQIDEYLTNSLTWVEDSNEAKVYSNYSGIEKGFTFIRQ